MVAGRGWGLGLAAVLAGCAATTARGAGGAGAAAGTGPEARPPPAPATPPPPGVPAPATPGDRLRPPFDAAAIRSAMPVGTVLRTRTEEDGKAPVTVRTTVAAADGVHCTLRVVTLDAAGRLIDDAGLRAFTWVELAEHGAFPASAKRKDARTTTAAGTFDGPVYEVRGPDGAVERFHFAASLPGPPVLHVVERGGRVVRRTELLSRSREVAAAPPATDPLTLREGVVLDRASGTLYLMAPDGSVEAVEARTGKVRWRSADASKPLWIDGKALLAQQGTALVVLDAASGRPARTCGGPWSPPPIDEGLGRRHGVVGTSAGAGKALLHWHVSTYYAGGAAPPPGMRTGSHTAGAVEVDLAGCAVRNVEYAPEKTAWSPHSSTVDGVEAAVTVDAKAGRARVVVSRMGAKGPLASVELAEGLAGYVTAGFTPDGRHVLAIVQDPPAPSTPIAYTATLAAVLGAGAPMVWRSSSPPGSIVPVSGVLIEVAPTVRALDPRGTELWSRPLRDTTYRGTYPPSAPR